MNSKTWGDRPLRMRRSVLIPLLWIALTAASVGRAQEAIDVLGVQSAVLGVTQRGDVPKASPGDSSAGLVELVLDAKQGKNPDLTEFRTMADPFEKTAGALPTREGLDDTRASGSSQFTKEGLATIIARLRGRSLVVVDLREESHGYVNGMAISWKGKDNAANRGMDLDEISKDEKSRLSELRDRKTARLIRVADDDGARDQTVGVTVDSVGTEKKLVKAAGAKYVRIPVQDHCHPEPRDVDRFTKLIRKVSPGEQPALATQVGIEVGEEALGLLQIEGDVRGRAAGDLVGVDRGDRSPRDGVRQRVVDQLAQRRARFLRQFHAYCRENQDGFETSWSGWLAGQGKTGRAE
ncbi:MAG: hypothetical protein HY815_23160 [Candidatus Riflebacteria bacterium]|nr:hypothetical protein [Candidatus Riflebacteria bacterium]